MAVILNTKYDQPLFETVLTKMEQIAAEALSGHGLPADAEVSLTLCDDLAIQELNKQWRNVDAPTDVLSFPLLDEEATNIAEELLVGDIIISTERAAAQASEFNHSLERELLYLFTHGMLHLLGYDHMEEEEQCEMRLQEELLLSLVGAERV